MANKLYPAALSAFQSGSINLTSDTIKASFMLSTHSYNAAHDFWDDVSANLATNGTTSALSSKSVATTATGSTFDAADTTATPDTSQSITAIVIWKDTGVAATSPLLAHIDTGTGMSFTSDGNPRSITWASTIWSIDNV